MSDQNLPIKAFAEKKAALKAAIEAKVVVDGAKVAAEGKTAAEQKAAAYNHSVKRHALILLGIMGLIALCLIVWQWGEVSKVFAAIAGVLGGFLFVWGMVCFIAGLSKRDCLLFLLTGAGLIFGAILLHDPFFGMN